MDPSTAVLFQRDVVEETACLMIANCIGVALYLSQCSEDQSTRQDMFMSLNLKFPRQVRNDQK